MKLKNSHKFFIFALICSVQLFSQTKMGNTFQDPDINTYEGTGENIALSHDGKIVAIPKSYKNPNGEVSVYRFVNDQWQAMGNPIVGPNRINNQRTYFGYNLDLSSDGSVLVIAERMYSTSGTNREGRFVFYKWDGTSWSSMGEVVNDVNNLNAYECKLSSDGLTMVMGSWAYTGNMVRQGLVRVYRYNSSNNSWNKIGANIVGTRVNSFSGKKVAISSNGNIVAVQHERGGNNQQGYVTVYEYDSSANQWNSIGNELVGLERYDFFGSGLDLSGDGNVLVIGTDREDFGGVNRAGRLRIYNRNGNAWNEVFSAAGLEQYDYFGRSLSISEDGKKIAVNQRGGSIGGRVRIFENVSSSWTETSSSTLPNLLGTKEGENFGYLETVLSGDGGVIGVHHYPEGYDMMSMMGSIGGASIFSFAPLSPPDADSDGVDDNTDNCVNTPNSSQADADGDGIGDACDPDTDGDGIDNDSDSCSLDFNPNQKDFDSDGIGDLCDPDKDNDGYNNEIDSFPLDPSEWEDTDSDGIGNNTDTDDDNDGYLDAEDAFPLDAREWLDTDGDGIGNNRDKDDDNDGVNDSKDAFPLDSNEYLDTDGDGIGNNADLDDDGDGYLDLDESECDSDPLKSYFKPRDYDKDLIPDCIDTDDDGDGCIDQEDPFPYDENACADTDGDGIADYYDSDSDNDGVFDELDAFPYDPNESTDTDGDGIGDNTDTDDNNDGFPEDPVLNEDGKEVVPLFVSELLTPTQPGVESKWRIVNIEKYPSANVKIYSTAWNVVYESWDYENNWTGKDKDGNPLPSGPYFYRIDRGDESKVEEGWLYIFN